MVPPKYTTFHALLQHLTRGVLMLAGNWSVWCLADVGDSGWQEGRHHYISLLFCRHGKAGKVVRMISRIDISVPYKDSNTGKLRETNTQFQKVFTLLYGDYVKSKFDHNTFLADIQKRCRENSLNFCVTFRPVDRFGNHQIDEICLPDHDVIKRSKEFTWPPAIEAKLVKSAKPSSRTLNFKLPKNTYVSAPKAVKIECNMDIDITQDDVDYELRDMIEQVQVEA